jgi:hypothetical protein
MMLDVREACKNGGWSDKMLQDKQGMRNHDKTY